MTPLVPIMMFGWIPIVLILFVKFTPRRAVIIAFIFAWLFLPIAKYSLAGLPDYTKMSATCWAIFIATALFNSQRLLSFRLKAIDIPMIIWCLSPLFSSLTNGLGLYDGVSGSLTQTVVWGFPYLIGRMYFDDLEGIRDLSIGIFIGGLIYIPLCLFESRMSPMLHYIFYGYNQHSFAQTYRWGGWRPMVFMNHGLMVGVWMMSSSLIGLWYWLSGSLKKLRGFSVFWLALALTITLILCRSSGAIALFLLGILVLFLTKKFHSKIFMICLIAIPLFYLSSRSIGMWSGHNLVDFISQNISQDRALSLEFRFNNENILVDKALQRPVFGWGGWNRSRVYNEHGRDISVTDGLWVLSFGKNGIVGLCSLTLSILLPVVLLLRKFSVKDYFNPSIASAMAISTLLILYMIDNLLNAMVNPIFMVAGGGLAAIAIRGVKVENEDFEEESLPLYEFSYRTRFI